ncbi:MAG: hypothetical protein HRU34_00870 [Richelia sp.]|nr:hypothetical protein [Richelia sp.]CDN16146.1 hypothetical protein RintRC_3924 [Richelia intracellularis]
MEPFFLLQNSLPVGKNGMKNNVRAWVWVLGIYLVCLNVPAYSQTPAISTSVQ